MFGLFTKGPTKDVNKVLAHLKTILPNDNSWFIAGGFALDPDTANDVDVYFRDTLSCNLAVNALSPDMSSEPLPRPFNIHPSGFPVIQLIRLYTGTPEEVLSSFDLDLCKVALLPSGERITVESTKNEITLNPDVFNRDTLSRVNKYIHKGYKLSPNFYEQLKAVEASRDRLTKTYYDEAVSMSYHEVLQKFIQYDSPYTVLPFQEVFKEFRKDYPEYYI